MPNRCVVRVSL